MENKKIVEKLEEGYVSFMQRAGVVFSIFFSANSILYISVFYILICFTNCNIKKSGKLLFSSNLSSPNSALVPTKEISTFKFDQITPPVTASISGNVISAQLLSSADVTNLVATFTTTANQVLVNNVLQISSVTANDFSSPVKYTAVAVDGSKNEYTVIVVPFTIPSSTKDILTFKFDQISPPIVATISGTSISAQLPSSIALTNLVATFTTTASQVLVNNVIQNSSTTANDFSSPVLYTAVASDGTKNVYSVTVSNAGNSVLGSVGNVNITGLVASDSPLEMYYTSSGNTFQSFADNTKIGAVLPNGTAYAIGIKTQPTGRVCALNSGSFSGILSADVSFSIKCVTGYLVGGKVIARPVTFSIPQNGAIVTTIAGSFPPTVISGTTDGIAGAARLKNPYGIASNGTDLYITDSGNHCVRKYQISTGSVTTVAGLCGTSGTVNGTGTSARFNNPMFSSTDGTNLYICDRGNNSIRKLDLVSYDVTTFAGLSGTSGDAVGIGTSARFSFPNGVTMDGTYLYVSDRNNHKIKRINIATTFVDTIAGTGVASSIDNATGTAATLNTPCDSVSIGTSLYLVECGGNRIRKIGLTSPFSVTTIAGNGVASSVDGIGLSASFNNPHGVETDGTNLFVMEWNGKLIRRVNINTLDVITIAGGTPGYQDGTGTGARVQNLGGITTDGNYLYFLDGVNSSLRKINNAPD